MNLKDTFLLGLVLGATEYLPVGASGHMTFLNEVLRLNTIPNMAVILMQLGLLLAVVLMHIQPIGHMLRHPLSSRLKWLILSVLPTVAVTLLLPQEIVEKLTSALNIGIFMLLTCVVLMVGEAARLVHEKKHRRISFFDALAMGLLRAAAVIPGTSRLGFSITGGLCTGLSRRRATDFAFLMFVPLLMFRIGMGIWEMYRQAHATGMTMLAELHNDIAQMGGVLSACVGTLTVTVTGCLAIALCRVLVKNFGMKWFSIYTGAMGLFLIAWKLLAG